MFEKYVDAMEMPQLLDRSGIEKTAEEKKDVDKKIIDFIKTIRPNKDKEQYVHIILMGTKEGWGANNNGDTFPEKDLFHEGNDYGYKTFLNAGIFTSHKNKDKGKTLGNIVLAIKNIPMKRVELIERLDRDLCRQHDNDLNVYDRIEAGEILMKSMGVRVPYDQCFPKGTLIRTTEGYKDIIEIKVGDEVRTHKGRNKKVTNLFISEPKELIKIQASGLPSISCTKNHPFLSIKEDQLRSCHGSTKGTKRRHTFDSSEICESCGKKIELNSEWREARDLSVGDYVMTPVDELNTKSIFGVGLARLFGYYVGDGNLIKDRRGRNKKGEQYITGFQITSNIKEEVHIKNVISSISQLNPKNPVRKYVDINRSAASIITRDKDLAYKLKEHCGEYSDKKRLSEKMFSMSKTEKMFFLGGWIDTDGSFDKKGRGLRICSINKGLLLDGQRILHSLEIPASVINSGKVGSFSGHTSKHDFSWALFIPQSHSKKFIGFSNKVTNTNNKEPGTRSLFWKNYWLTRILSIEEAKEETVYNFSVEEDESYIANGYAVHNCTYCGNKAKTRADYCSHALNYMGKIMPNGIRISVDNPCPVGFDSSWVRNPAFRPASLVGVLKEKDGVTCLGNICVINTNSDKKEDMKKEAAVLPKIPPKREIDNTNSLDENVTTVNSIVKTAEFPPWAQEIMNQSNPPAQPAKKKGKTTKVVRKITYRGIPVSIEVMSGDMRIGYNRGGKWKKRMGCHYGFIPSTEGHDGEEIDVYLKPGANKNADVYIVHQMKNKDGIRSFDEDKVMLGFDSQYEAKSVYLQHMPEKYFGGIQTKSFEEFKNTLPSHEELEKQAQHILKEAFCCGPCCKTASMVKEVPATVSSLLSKVKVKNSLQSH